MGASFRNVDASPTEDVTTWPYEAIVEVIDQGLVPDWQPLLADIKRSPWGRVARRVERYLSYRDPDGVGTFFSLAIEHARREAARSEREAVAGRVRAAIERSGLTSSAFAELIGTSASRLSTYVSGKVTPSAAMLIRIEGAGHRDPASPVASAR